MKHLINRLQFQLYCTDEAQALNFRQHFGASFQKQIMDAADNICSKNVGDEEWLQIDKLEIDLGNFSPSSFEETFAIVFKNKFEKELTQKISRVPLSKRKASLHVSKVQLLQYFLLKGSLPWWAGNEEADINEILIELISCQPQVIKSFFYQHQFKKNLWTRTCFQLNTDAKEKLISLIEELKAAKEIFFKWISLLTLLFSTEAETALPITHEMVDDIVLKIAPDILRIKKNVSVLLEFFEKNIAALSTNGSTNIHKLIKESSVAFTNKAYENISSVYEDKGKFFESSNKGLEKTSKANGNAGEVGEKINLEKNSISNIDIQISVTQSDDEQEIETEKYIVKHAGIVLLAPFLKPFFSNLNLLNGNEWTSKDAQYKAVHLLRFLSTGEHKSYEYNLTLEKIMCGIHIEEPVPLDIELNNEGTTEAIELLESVIKNWKVLKNTSITGLRESFFKRDGILTAKEKGWLLQVERKTLDVLIDSIPWGYNTIVLSWNDDLIFVEW